MKFVKFCIVLLLLGVLLALAGGAGLYYWAEKDLRLPQARDTRRPSHHGRARDGQIVGYFYRENASGFRCP
jgi:hypothetical protein